MNNNKASYRNYLPIDNLSGPAIGACQVILGHPLDSLKAIKQTGKHLTPYHFQVQNLYRGVGYPLALNTFYQTLLFTSHHKINDTINNHFVSGLISGSILGAVSNPFEYHKIKAQTQINKPKIEFTPKSFYCGLYPTILRESFATSIYFGSFYKMKENNVPVPLAGGISGILSWLLTYPIDTWKTRVQSGWTFQSKPCFDIIYDPKACRRTKIKIVDPIGAIRCKYEKFKREVFKPSNYKGLGYCLSRAFLINSVSFMIYDYCNI